MKRGNKVVLGIVSVGVALCMGVSLAACSSSEHEHTWDSGTVTVEATCTTNGLKTYTCTDCGQTMTEPIAALGHAYVQTSVDASCTTAGYTTYVCSRCGRLDTEQSSLTQPSGHTYTSSTTDATCTEAGSTTYTCSEGDSTYTVPGAAATGHSYVATTTTPATCTTDGSVTYKCSACGDTYTETIAALGHSYGAVETTATCTQGGVTTYVCSTCGDTYTDNESDPLGHTPDPETGVPADDGSIIYTCITCGERYIVEPLEQDDSWLDSEETEQGVTTYEIDSAEQLTSLAAYINSGEDMDDAVIELTSDIDLGNTEWTPIGNTPYNDTGYDETYSENESAFMGTFDGNDHTISNLHIDAGSTYGGLFGYIYGATIENVTIENATVTGGQDVGALVGNSGDTQDSVQAVIANCSVTGLIQISGDHFVGGLVGRAEATVIQNCSVEGDAGSYVEGVYVGSDYEGDAVGGLIGFIMNRNPEATNHNYQTSQIIDVTVSGLDISGSRKVGGFVGNLCDNNNASEKAPVITSTESNRNTVKNCSISITVVDEDNYTTENSAKLFVGALVGEFTGYSLTVENCDVDTVTIYYYTASCVYGLTDDGDSAYIGIYGGSREAGFEVTLSDCTCTNVNCVSLITAGPTDPSWQDTKTTETVDGEEVTTYTVDSAAQLVNIAEYINATSSDGNQLHDLNNSVVQIDDDIDLDGYAWIPIGVEEIDSTADANEPFSGTFDGKGNTISNIEIACDTGDDAVGFFGLIDNATITDLTLENVTATGSHGVGALAGWCDLVNEGLSVASVISNVTVKGLVQISGSKQVGGLVGLGNKTAFENCTIDADEGSYIKCEYEDSSYYGQCAGGLVGAIGVTQNTGIVSYVKDCTVKGLDISACVDAGGMIGYEIVMGQRHSGGNVWSHSDDDSDEYFKMENCTVEDCNISIDLSSAPDDFATDRTDLFAGAFVGESLYSMALTNCSVSNVTVTTYSTAFTHSATVSEEGDATYIGFIGGSRSYSTIQYDYNNCSGEVTMAYVYTATDTDTEDTD